jgi:mono/diheme cytochrome c family protein
MRLLLKLMWHLLAVVGLAAAIAGGWFYSQGISTRTPPRDVEVAAARRARQLMIPVSARGRRNPEMGSAETIRSGLEHWADHCAGCHANDGSGDTAIGRGLFPRAPDMRLPATQDLTDGELFYIIENGVKLTGMPAWGAGTPDGEADSWHLVHFIRRLPSLTEDELAAMAELNPRSPAEWRALEDERAFLAGDSPPSTAPATPHLHK